MNGFGAQKKNKVKPCKGTTKRSTDALLNSAVDHHKRGDLGNAEKDYRKAIMAGAIHHVIFSNLGIICKNSGRVDEAISLYLKAIKINPNYVDAHTNLGNLYREIGNLDKALASTLNSIKLNPDNPTAHMNLGIIYRDLGNLDQALASTLNSIKLNPDNPTAHMNLGIIYRDLGNLDQALASTLNSIKLNPDNPTAHLNLGGIYQELGNLDQALAYTLRSLEIKPKWSPALCKLGLIKMSLGQTKEARKDLLISIKYNAQECESYYALSTMLDTSDEAEELIELARSIKASALTPKARAFAEFALSNCFHKIKKYYIASKHLELANKCKSTAYPSNTDILLQEIALSTSHFETDKEIDFDKNIGERRIFIVGMPRSGSTLLETVLSMNPEIKDLGESRSLKKAILKAQEHERRHKSNQQDLNELYTEMEPIDSTRYKYTTDKNLYNFIHISAIASHMPAAKIIHCCRNPMDNILSIYRSNLMAGNNYTGNLEDTARVLVAQEQAMQIQKKRYPEKIFTFDYDQFVHAPEENLRKLLEWLELEPNESYLHPEKSTRSINTASVMQARKPISNKSVGGWKNYETLLNPALKIVQESGIKLD